MDKEMQRGTTAPQPRTVPHPAAVSRVMEDVEEFQRSFPEVYEQVKENMARLPDEVWDMVRQGATLTAAYARYCVKHCREQQPAFQCAGSMRSAGDDCVVADPFLKGFWG